MKIAIIGYSGSGKSTLARKLAKYYKAPVLFLDTVNFLPNWIERDRDEGRLIVCDFMKNDSWIIDGNYSDFFQKERLEQADKIIFLKFPRRICIYRALKRYFRYKNTTREDMAKGCIEKIDLEFIWWILYEGRTKKIRNHYKQIEKNFKNKIVVLKKAKEVNLFLQKITNS
ncbi:DNA topology modulation protein [Romboutsia sp. 1001216sp1]|nr:MULTISPECIES: DNA topology modulation protein [Romboutsia]MDB8794576.1 DNA topology modulation protein [Romboutsia sp. 1001216sp1]MDB8796146.1 DNA topology modulation protein [Romboutsia sp. 1001216sp1]MDB8798139.1 DNA topology modulation protein [Romboutsia sp. 1001216sp1]MDB8801137.1 DNA topology modulation protein [Romboutsia sp. 1001216sp1]MDB8812536.1 DNA topology modulation protein [Romboutsia sp. 1001216sp1]